MNNKKSLIILIVSIVLSLSIGFGSGFLIGKNGKHIFKSNNSNEYSDKDFSVTIDKIEIIKLDYDYKSDSQYQYYVENESDYIEQYVSQFDNNYNIFIYYSFENKSDSPKSILNTVQFKVFSNGVALQTDNNDAFIARLYPDVFALCNNVNTEIQSGKKINACFTTKISQYKELLDKSFEININKIIKGDFSTKKELLKTINYNFSDIPLRKVTYKTDDKNNYIIVK